MKKSDIILLVYRLRSICRKGKIAVSDWGYSHTLFEMVSNNSKWMPSQILQQSPPKLTGNPFYVPELLLIPLKFDTFHQWNAYGQIHLWHHFLSSNYGFMINQHLLIFADFSPQHHWSVHFLSEASQIPAHLGSSCSERLMWRAQRAKI